MAKKAGVNMIGSRHATVKLGLNGGVATCGSVAWCCGDNLWDALPVSATAAPHIKIHELSVAESWRLIDVSKYELVGVD